MTTYQAIAAGLIWGIYGYHGGWLVHRSTRLMLSVMRIAFSDHHGLVAIRRAPAWLQVLTNCVLVPCIGAISLILTKRQRRNMIASLAALQFTFRFPMCDTHTQDVVDLLDEWVEGKWSPS